MLDRLQHVLHAGHRRPRRSQRAESSTPITRTAAARQQRRRHLHRAARNIHASPAGADRLDERPRHQHGLHRGRPRRSSGDDERRRRRGHDGSIRRAPGHAGSSAKPSTDAGRRRRDLTRRSDATTCRCDLPASGDAAAQHHGARARRHRRGRQGADDSDVHHGRRFTGGLRPRRRRVKTGKRTRPEAHDRWPTTPSTTRRSRERHVRRDRIEARARRSAISRRRRTDGASGEGAHAGALRNVSGGP